MTILFAGTSTTDFLNDTEVSTQSSYRPSHVLEAVMLNGSNFALSPQFPPQVDFWLSFYLYTGSYDDDVFLEFLNSNGEAKFRLRRNTGRTATTRIEAYDGTSWVTLFTTNSGYDPRSLHRIDVHIKIDGTVGELEFYLDKLSLGSFTGNTLLEAGVAISQFKLYPNYYSSSYDVRYSAIIASDESTLTKSLVQTKFSSAGTHADWDGTYLNLNGPGDNGGITTDTVDALSTFIPTAIPAPFDTGHLVEAVVLGSAGKASTDLDVVGAVRAGLTDYEVGSFGYENIPGPKQLVLATNPATGVAWTVAEVDSAEFGVKLKNA